jgi:hypothetical protein
MFTLLEFSLDGVSCASSLLQSLALNCFAGFEFKIVISFYHNNIRQILKEKVSRALTTLLLFNPIPLAVLGVDPLIGAISAGCAAVLKPSEITPTVSSILADLLPKYLDTDAIRVVEGGVPITTALLAQKWDKIFYTGILLLLLLLLL